MSVDMMMNWAGHTGLDISILIVLVLVCRRPFVNLFGARAAYALWVLPLLRLVLPETPITLPKPSWMQAATTAPSEIMSTPILEAINSSPVAAQINWQLPIIALWLCIAAIWFARQLWRQHQYMKTVQENSVPASRHIRGKLDEARKALGMKTVPILRLSSTNIGPLVSGIFRPIIVLPHNFETDFTTQQQFFALTHELAHIKRGDLWAALGALVFRALNWPNPLVHLCAAKFRADQESACDAYVLNIIGGGAQTKQSYAATLIHSAKLTRNSARTPTEQAPLCLTIYHPLKERLMTMKISKTNTSMLSRIGVGAFLVAALTATAPITFAASSQTTGPDTASTPPKVKTISKKTMKWTEIDDDGVVTSKQYEISIEDGVTTAYSIDEHGNRTLIDASEIDIKDDDNEEGNIRIIVTDALDDLAGAETLHMTGDGHSKIFIKRMTTNGDGMVIDMNEDAFVMDTGGHASAMVSAAQSLLDQADDKDLSNNARRKLAKARKALKEAQEAIEAEE